jgi:hypothetical protein
MAPSPPNNQAQYGSLSNGNGKTMSSSSPYNHLENGHHDTESSSSERASLLVDNGSNKTDDYQYTSSSKKFKLGRCAGSTVKWCSISTVLLGVALLGRFLVLHFWTFHEPHDSHLDPNYRHGPLSQLDPVADLGMHAFERPRSSQPTVHLVSKEDTTGTAQDSQDGGSTTNKASTVLPTNSWYQSFLLLDPDHDKPPTSLDRVYSIPYIVDAAGPIAGLRIYPHHVGATSNVIQTYTIENQGLTMGLSRRVPTDGNMTKKESSSSSSSSGGGLSKRYQVENMTPLGITLSWVSFFVYFCQQHSLDSNDSIALCFLILFICWVVLFFLNIPTDELTSQDDRRQRDAIFDHGIRKSSHYI